MLSTSITNIARRLRKEQTEEEKALWEMLRNRKVNGIKFLRQHPLIYDDSKRKYFYVVDFYSAEKKLVIELDGGIHQLQHEKDSVREDNLRKLGCNILRIQNADLKDKVKVLEKIIEALKI